MKIYQSEIDAGLSSALLQNSTLAYSPIQIRESNSDLLKRLLDKSIARNMDQVDLYYMSSVLVTTGWNLNDDVFDPRETYNARNTPEDKPFNFMHNEKDIIGHITGNYIIDRDGNVLGCELDSIPDFFDIVTSSVVYKAWSDETQKERIAQLISEIEAGNKWYVSMECLFPNFDYALLDSKGEQHIIHREESSAFLTKHLKAYGGAGFYENYKLGRLLRNFSFSGKGLVDKPGNPRSIIIKETQAFSEAKASQISVSSIVEKKRMDETLKNLENEVAALKAELATLKTEASTAAVTIQEKDSAVSKLTEELNNVKAELAKVSAEKTDVTNKLNEAQAKFDKMEKDAKCQKRKAALVEAGLEESELETTLAKFESLEDDVFEHVVALMKKDKKDDKAKKDAEAAEAAKKASEKAKKDAEAAQAALDNAIENKEPDKSEETTNKEDAVRTAASEWFSNSVLKSTAKFNNKKNGE